MRANRRCCVLTGELRANGLRLYVGDLEAGIPNSDFAHPSSTPVRICLRSNPDFTGNTEICGLAAADRGDYLVGSDAGYSGNGSWAFVDASSTPGQIATTTSRSEAFSGFRARAIADGTWLGPQHWDGAAFAPVIPLAETMRFDDGHDYSLVIVEEMRGAFRWIDHYTDVLGLAGSSGGSGEPGDITNAGETPQEYEAVEDGHFFLDYFPQAEVRVTVRD